ncbi:MAG: uracil-DNA glycosylase [Nanoarchaeota archaeon]|nr:uracil-DNA glycosylase [Nanoarchaeota archaeon]
MACKWITICPLRKFEEEGKLELKWKKEYCENDFENCRRFQAEENCIPHPDNMLPNGEIMKGLK